MQIVITHAGYNALVNAQHTGTHALTIAAIALGNGTAPATPDSAGLGDEVKRIETIAGEVLSDNRISVTIRDGSNDAYTVREFGLYTDDGTLFALYAQDDVIIEKSPATSLLLTVDCEFVDVSTDSITFGDASFSNPPASETVQGVAEIATAAETDAGTDDQRIVTPRKLKPMLPKPATTQAAGLVERATLAEAKAGDDDQRYITASQIARLLADAKTDFIDANNPVETIREFRDDDRTPASILGLPNSTWEYLGNGRVTLGAGNGYSAGHIAGQENVRLTRAQLPKIRPSTAGPIGVAGGDGAYFDYIGYSVGDNLQHYTFANPVFNEIGGGEEHYNMMPYIVVYRWVRTA